MPSLDFKPLNILSFGAGAIGTYIGGSLVLSGHNVVFVEQPKSVQEIQKRGLRLDLSLDKRRKKIGLTFVRPMAFVVTSSIQEALEHGPFDAALFAVKSYDTPRLLEEITPFADKLPTVLCLSNGVDNEPALARVIGEGKVLPGTVTSAIGRLATGDIVLEKLRGVGLAAGHALSERLAGELDTALLNCRTYSDAVSMKWSKLLTNLLANATSAILDLTPSQVFAHPGLYDLEMDMLRECLMVMKAQALEVVDLPGTPVRALAFVTRLPVWISRLLLSRWAGSGRGGKMPSFHIDLHSKKGQSEVDYLNGAVVRAGLKLSIPTPINKILTDTLIGLTKGDLPLEEYTHQPEKFLQKIK